jgi:hypothetical protein
VQSLEFTDLQAIQAVVSPLGERLALSFAIQVPPPPWPCPPPQPREAKGCVDRWLGELSQQMVATMEVSAPFQCRDTLHPQDLLVSSREGYSGLKRAEWVAEWPGQVVLTVCLLVWTAEIQEAIKGGEQVSRCRGTLRSQALAELCSRQAADIQVAAPPSGTGPSPGPDCAAGGGGKQPRQGRPTVPAPCTGCMTYSAPPALSCTACTALPASPAPPARRSVIVQDLHLLAVTRQVGRQGLTRPSRAAGLQVHRRRITSENDFYWARQIKMTGAGEEPVRTALYCADECLLELHYTSLNRSASGCWISASPTGTSTSATSTGLS